MEKFHQRRIAFYCLNDPLDKRSWSGIPYYLGKALEKNIGQVSYLGPVRVPWIVEKIMRGIMKLSRRLLRKEYLPQYSLLKNRYASWFLSRRMRGKEYDFVLAPAAASELAFLKTDVPIIYFGDATFKSYSGTYESVFRNVNRLSLWEGDWLEKRSLRKSAMVLMTSQWAAESAVRDYGTPADKVECLLMGANIDAAPPRTAMFRKEENETLSLLFLAVDWERKGGTLAMETLAALLDMGVQARLFICGCTPPGDIPHPGATVIPFIDKNVPEDNARLDALLSSCHFLLLPTRADCSLLVAMEANAYGMPAITTAVGGVPEVVQDGVNGYCLSLQADGVDYARLIAGIFADKPRYHALIESSRNRYETTLNWESWAQQFESILRKRNF